MNDNHFSQKKKETKSVRKANKKKREYIHLYVLVEDIQHIEVGCNLAEGIGTLRVEFEVEPLLVEEVEELILGDSEDFDTHLKEEQMVSSHLVNKNPVLLHFVLYIFQWKLENYGK